MAKILIGYDLNKAGQNYTKLIAKIESLSPGNYFHCLDSTWIIETSMSPMDVCNALMPFRDANDELFVVNITGQGAAWVGFDTQCSNWLQNNL